MNIVKWSLVARCEGLAYWLFIVSEDIERKGARYRWSIFQRGDDISMLYDMGWSRTLERAKTTCMKKACDALRKEALCCMKGHAELTELLQEMKEEAKP